MVGGSAIREGATSSLLARLPAEAWAVFGASGTVGHVVVGPAGLFVISTKGWSGVVEVRDDVLRHDGRARATVVADAVDAASAMSRLVPMLPRAQVRSVLCFVRAEPLSTRAAGVLVSSTASLLETLTSLPPALTPGDVRRASVELRRALPSTEPTARELWAWTA
jgi:hypothetical protein